MYNYTQLCGVLTYISFTAALTIHALHYFSWKQAHIPSLCFALCHLTVAVAFSLHVCILYSVSAAAYHDKLSKHVLSWAWCSCYEECSNVTKCRIAASINVVLPENGRLVRVLSLRTTSGEYNTGWFMLFLRVWIIVIASVIVALSWWRKERRKKVRRLTICPF